MWEWLKCPVCDGQGTVSKSSWVAGDQQSWASSGTETYPCWACGGTGTIEKKLCTEVDDEQGQ